MKFKLYFVVNEMCFGRQLNKISCLIFCEKIKTKIIRHLLLFTVTRLMGNRPVEGL